MLYRASSRQCLFRQWQRTTAVLALICWAGFKGETRKWKLPVPWDVQSTYCTEVLTIFTTIIQESLFLRGLLFPWYLFMHLIFTIVSEDFRGWGWGWRCCAVLKMHDILNRFFFFLLLAQVTHSQTLTLLTLNYFHLTPAFVPSPFVPTNFSKPCSDEIQLLTFPWFGLTLTRVMKLTVVPGLFLQPLRFWWCPLAFSKWYQVLLVSLLILLCKIGVIYHIRKAIA